MILRACSSLKQQKPNKLWDGMQLASLAVSVETTSRWTRCLKKHTAKVVKTCAKRWKAVATVNVVVIPDRVAGATACVNRGKKTMTMTTVNVAEFVVRALIPGTDIGKIWTGWILMSAFRKE
nr:MAG TPA: hypothetical protein [Caudoviricetes sp.]